MRMRHILNNPHSPQPRTMAEPPARSPADPAPATLGHVLSRDLLGNRREVIIQHGQEQYRLCLTSSNKLILIK